MAPTTLPTSPSLTHSLTKRLTSCAYYDSACSTQRTIIICVVIAIIVLKILILFLLFRRWYKRKDIRRLEVARQQRMLEQQQHAPWFSGDAPPAYEAELPRRPESSVSAEVVRAKVVG
ncbi:hypothetical protein B0J11DRAFT_579276 [Dendryphion nanum]|uniref:Uncharacterized protein n=1 Tax=Dendryphion nanum TaxID=256645 RepID=A0A9P9DVA9_9PLEO|nr:hypothetical protein B0J11DRAFT_579276 [Dendryphion nanum]